MSTHFHLVTHVSLPKFATKVDLPVFFRKWRNSWEKNGAPCSLRSSYASAVWISTQKWEKLSVSWGPQRLYANTAFSLPGTSPPHRAGPWDGHVASPPRSHLCQDTNSHKTKQYKNKRPTVKNPSWKICLPGTQTWANTSGKFALGAYVYWILASH